MSWLGGVWDASPAARCFRRYGGSRVDIGLICNCCQICGFRFSLATPFHELLVTLAADAVHALEAGPFCSRSQR